MTALTEQPKLTEQPSAEPDSGRAETQTAPELEIAQDLARRSLWLLPIAIAVGALGWGVDGAVSAAFGSILAVVNLVVAALIIARAGRRSSHVLMAAILGGFFLRFAVLTVAALLLRQLSWIEQTPLLFTMLVMHLVLLVWETRYVSLSLAYPGLKPTPPRRKVASS